MKRILLCLALASLVAPARAQLFNAPMTPTTPGSSMALGAGLPAALANPANSNGGVTLLGGSAAQGNCLSWGANGIQDAGSPCLTAPAMGAANISGAGAPVATSLANRATDSGVTFNLKNDFGAACNGSTDDTMAIQNWLNKAAANVHLVAPAGNCLFSSPVKIAAVNGLRVAGAGAGATVFTYNGTDYNGVVTAAASWSAAATTLTLSSSTLPTHVSAALAAGYPISVWDTTSSRYVGSVASISGATLTLAAGAVYASQGSSDSLHLTTDLVTFGQSAGGGHNHLTLSDFSIMSSTVMTGGFALHLHGMFDSVVSNVFADDVNSAAANSGNLCGAFWFDGVGGVQMYGPRAYSTQNCGDGLLVNAAQGGAAQLLLFGGDIGGHVVSGAAQGFVNGYHMAGGIGGLRCDSSNVHNNLVGVLIDDAVVATSNREFNQGSTCAFDTNQNAGVIVNDALASGGTVDLAGWEASTLTGHGVVIQSWPSGDVEMRGNKIYNNCGSGVYVQDATTHVLFSPASAINGNGSANLNSLCTAWKTANAGHGWGIEAASVTTNLLTNAVQPFGNTAGAINGNAVGTFALATPNASLTSLAGSAAFSIFAPVGADAWSFYQVSGASGFRVGQVGDVSGSPFGIRDASTGTDLLEAQPGSSGAVTLFRPLISAQAVTLTGAVTFGSTSSTANTGTTAQAGAGYNAWNFFQVNGSSGFRVGQVGNESGNPFVIRDASNGLDAIQIATGGATTLGSEGPSTTTGVTGAFGVSAASSAPTASGSCTVGTLTGGQIAGSFKNSSSACTGTVILTFAATQTHGYSCDAHDTTTLTGAINQSGVSPTSVTFSGAMAANDVIVWKCFGF